MRWKIIVHKHGGTYYASRILDNDLPGVSPITIFAMTEEVKPEDFPRFEDRVRAECRYLGIPYVVNLDPPPQQGESAVSGSDQNGDKGRDMDALDADEEAGWDRERGPHCPRCGGPLDEEGRCLSCASDAG